MKTQRIIKTFTLFLFATLLALFVLTGGDLTVLAGDHWLTEPIDTPPQNDEDTPLAQIKTNPIDTMDSISARNFILMSTSKSALPIRRDTSFKLKPGKKR